MKTTIFAIIGLFGLIVPSFFAAEIVFPGAEWERREPGDLGLNTNAVAEISKLMERAKANGVLVYKGYLIAEWNFNGPATQQFEVQSVTKSITSMMLGLTLMEGLTPSIDAKVKDYYPRFNAGPYADEITFRHLVTATSGIALRRLCASLRYNADKIEKPGTESRYHNEHTVHLARAMTWLWRRDLETVLHERVLKHIGASMKWDKPWKVTIPVGDPESGETQEVPLVRGSCHSHWTAQDLARVGWLYANNGNWNGEQLLPAEYVDQSMTPIPEPVMRYRGPERDEQLSISYGFSWWGRQIEEN